ncbi:MAG TPA: hypothetical protein EYQ63_00065, partial [Fuerstia sp.]|nr:hypothetical protein [Fuerstiella sp.]
MPARLPNFRQCVDGGLERFPVDDVGIEEARNRFNHVFAVFISAVSHASHPLVIFLDDLQWADPGLLDLLEVLMCESGSRNLLLVGAYRTNEVDDAHPLARTIRRIQDHAQVHTLQLDNLQRDAVAEFVADTLAPTVELSAPLTDLVYRKTGGNAFFLRQFLGSLHDDGFLQFDRADSRWRRDLEQIRDREYSANVLDLMSEKITTLPAATRKVLQTAACIGARFNLSLLSDAMSEPYLELADHLRAAVDAGLVQPSSPKARRVRIGDHDDPEAFVFSFLHDRVQEGAYALIPLNARPATHLQIARLLMQSAQCDESDGRLFDVAGHLNLGADLIHDPAERSRAARHNELAAGKAFWSTAYQSASEFYKFALRFLETSDLTTPDRESLRHRMEIGQARSEYLGGHPRHALAIIEAALSHTHLSVQRVALLLLRSIIETNLPDIAAARETIRDALREHGCQVHNTAAEYRAAVETAGGLHAKSFAEQDFR